MLKIDDFHELNALVKVLCSFKFDSEGPDRLLGASSPFVAQVITKAYDALIEVAKEKNDLYMVKALTEGRPVQLDTLIFRRIQEDVKLLASTLVNMTHDQQVEVLANLASPYALGVEELNQLLAEI